MATVIVCDCNSDPNSGVVGPRDKAPPSAVYQLLTQRGGFSVCGCSSRVRPGQASRRIERARQ